MRRILKYIFKNCIIENEDITKMIRWSEANIHIVLRHLPKS